MQEKNDFAWHWVPDTEIVHARSQCARLGTSLGAYYLEFSDNRGRLENTLEISWTTSHSNFYLVVSALAHYYQFFKE